MRDDFNFPPGIPARPMPPPGAKESIDIDSDVVAHFTARAEEKGLDTQELINEILRQEMALALMD